MKAAKPKEKGHLVYIVDDDPVVAALVVEIVQSRRDRAKVFGNVEDALAAFAVERPCYGILDQQLPINAKSKMALVSAGEQLVEEARAMEARYHGRWHVMQLIVLSGHATDSDFAVERIELGADAFVGKPLDAGQIAKLIGKIKLGLDRSGRTDHADCARCVKEATRERAAIGLPPAGRAGDAEGAGGDGDAGAALGAAAAVLEPPRLVIDGIKVGTRSAVVINGHTREMKDSVFILLLRLVAAEQRRPGSWSTRQTLGLVGNSSRTSYLRDVFDGLVPEGFEVLLGDKAGSFRLNPGIVIERVEWGVLAEHPNDGVKRVAREMRGREK